MKLLLLALLLPATVFAQPAPVQPQPGLQGIGSAEIRLKGAPTLTNPSPTVRLSKVVFKNLDSKTFIHTEACWNAKTACPLVVAATVRVFIELPWLGRVNVSRFVLCNATECLLPAFAPLSANPGQAYRFSYDRYTAAWTEPPAVIHLP